MWQACSENKDIARFELADSASGNQVSGALLNKGDLKFVVLMQYIVQVRLIVILYPNRFVYRLCYFKWQNLHQLK
jgi:hypothetical protein